METETKNQLIRKNFFYTLKNAGLFQLKFGSNIMEKKKKNAIKNVKLKSKLHYKPNI